MHKFSLSPTRRQFIATTSTLAAVMTLPRAIRAQSAAATLADKLATDPMRPQFHLLPSHNWMNDPNAPIYFNGSYHMFFQFNPLGPTWGNMSWNHAVSNDMLHWTHLPLALTPTPGSADAYGVFSGSAFQLGNRVYAIYTGTRESTPALATIRDGTDRIQESQCLAYSDDPQLIHWTKLPQPVVPLPPPGVQITGFRDPSIWKQIGWFYMTLGAGIARVGGDVLLYRSHDLKSWQYLHPLASGRWNGKPTPNPCDDGEMWECPDFFALDGGHVLIYSTLGKVFWQSGDLDSALMTFKPLKTGLLDLDAFYAPKTQLDAHGRRILWGWIPERRSEDAMRRAGWSGMMSLPRILNLDPDGTLRVTSLPQTASLRSRLLPSQEFRSGVLRTLPGACGEVRCSLPRDTPSQFTLSTRANELLRVTYSPGNHAFLADTHEVPLQPGDLPTLHVFIDGSVIELILGERIGYTKRFYYEGPAPDVRVHATASTEIKLDAWSVMPISHNRLTATASSV